MALNNKVFKRCEIKYLVTTSQRARLEEIFSEHMVPDKYGRSTICNIYYDTPSYQLIRKSIDKPVYKEKMRLRSYGQVSEGGEVFLELKKKYDGVVYKRRISLAYDDAMRYLEGKALLPVDSQIGREIDYFHNYYKDLRPSAYICYDRTAYYDAEDDSFRITFDENILYRNTNMTLTSAPGGKAILEDGMALMEVKTAGSIPLWLVDALNELGIRQWSFSKYGSAFADMIKQDPELIRRYIKTEYYKANKHRADDKVVRYEGRLKRRIV